MTAVELCLLAVGAVQLLLSLILLRSVGLALSDYSDGWELGYAEGREEGRGDALRAAEPQLRPDAGRASLARADALIAELSGPARGQLVYAEPPRASGPPRPSIPAPPPMPPSRVSRAIDALEAAIGRPDALAESQRLRAELRQADVARGAALRGDRA